MPQLVARNGIESDDAGHDATTNEPELTPATPYTDCGLDEADVGVWTLLGGAEGA